MKLDPNIYQSDNFLVVDFETAHYEMPDPTATNPKTHVILACWWIRGKYKYVWGTELELQELYDDLETVDYFVAHRGSFELGFLERAGVSTHKSVLADTKVAEYVIAGNRPWQTSLEDCCARHGMPPRRTQYVSKLIKAGICPTTIPQGLLLSYCLEDVERELRVWKLQRQELNEKGLLPVFFSRCFATPALVSIELNGIHVDAEPVKEEYRLRAAEVRELESKLKEITGGINFRSGKQVGEFLYETLKFKQLTNKWGDPKQTPTGRPLTDSDTLLALKAITKKQKAFQELIIKIRKAQTYLSKILNPLKLLVKETADHILHFSLNQTITRTHRLSSTGKDPYNLQGQNLPRMYKRFFNSRDSSWPLLVADYAQLEFNVAAFLAQCPVAMKDVQEKRDVHKQSASIMCGCKPEDVTPDQRQAAKADTFGPLYGKVSGTPAQVKYFKWFRQHYKGIEKTMQGWIEEAIRIKQTVMQTGLVFYWPGAKMMADGYVANSTNIRNYPIQNFASAEITLPGVRLLWQEMKERGLKSRLVSTIHDSVLAEVHPEEKELMEALVAACLIGRVKAYLYEVYGIVYNLPLRVDIKLGDRWS